jgi:hypothetical protein
MILGFGETWRISKFLFLLVSALCVILIGHQGIDYCLWKSLLSSSVFFVFGQYCLVVLDHPQCGIFQEHGKEEASRQKCALNPLTYAAKSMIHSNNV